MGFQDLKTLQNVLRGLLFASSFPRHSAAMRTVFVRSPVDSSTLCLQFGSGASGVTVRAPPRPRRALAHQRVPTISRAAIEGSPNQTKLHVRAAFGRPTP